MIFVEKRCNVGVGAFTISELIWARVQLKSAEEGWIRGSQEHFQTCPSPPSRTLDVNKHPVKKSKLFRWSLPTLKFPSSAHSCACCTLELYSRDVLPCGGIKRHLRYAGRHLPSSRALNFSFTSASSIESFEKRVTRFFAVCTL